MFRPPPGAQASEAPAAPKEKAPERIQLSGIICQYKYPWNEAAPSIHYLLTSNGTYLLPGSIPANALWKKVLLEANKPSNAPILENFKVLNHSLKDLEQTFYRMEGSVAGADRHHHIKGDPVFRLSIPGTNLTHAPSMAINHTETAVALKEHYNRPARIEAFVSIHFPPPLQRKPGPRDQVSFFSISPHPVLTIMRIESLTDVPDARNLPRKKE